MQNIRIFIVDDHEVVIAGLEAILTLHKNFELIGTAHDGKDAYEKIKRLKPEIIILDINIPEISGLELCAMITKELPETKIIFHTCAIDEETIIKGFEAGAFGYIPKEFKSSDLVEAVEAAVHGRKYLKGIISEIVVNKFLKVNTTKNANEPELSERELEVVKCISQGYLNKQIADILGISQRTVEGHKSNILKKLKLTSTTELIIYSIKKGIIKI